MPLYFVTEHPQGQDIVRHRIQNLPFCSKHPHALILASGIERLHPPQAVYELRADYFAEGKMLDDSVQYRAHRYLVDVAGQPYAAAEVIWHLHGPGKHYVDINIGRFVGATAHALRYLEAHEQVRFGSFEARFLRCRPLCLIALWLKSSLADYDDLFFPLGGATPSPFEAERLYPSADFQGNMQVMMQQSLNTG